MFKSTQGSQRPQADDTGHTTPRLSPEAAQFYADVYVAAKAGCCRDLRRFGCSGEEAEEIFMATCEKVMRLIDPIARAFEPPQMVALLKIASRRVLIDDRRHRAVLTEVGLDRVGPVTDSTAATPDEIVEDREIAAIGREAVSVLSLRDQRIFRLRHQLDLTPAEVRGQLPGLSHRAYRRRIERGNAKVLQAFNDIVSGYRCKEMKLVHLRLHAQVATSEQQAKEIELHIAHCSACRHFYSKLLRLRAPAAPPAEDTEPENGAYAVAENSATAPRT